MENRAFGVRQTAERLQISISLLRKLIRNHQISYVRAGDRILFSEKHIADFLEHGTAPACAGKA